MSLCMQDLTIYGTPESESLYAGPYYIIWDP